jgi:hypothetical protein
MVGGLVYGLLGRVRKGGETVRCAGVRFTVLEVARRRIVAVRAIWTNCDLAGPGAGPSAWSKIDARVVTALRTPVIPYLSRMTSETEG